MGYTLLEHAILDAANRRLSDGAFRVLVALLRETKARLRCGRWPAEINNEEVPYLSLRRSRLGWEVSRRRYYAAIKELKETGFIDVRHQSGGLLHARLLPSAWRRRAGEEDADAAKRAQIGSAQDDNHARTEHGQGADRAQNDNASPLIQYKNTTPPAPKPSLTLVNNCVYLYGEEEALEREEKPRGRTAPSAPLEEECLPLLEALRLRAGDGPVPESWRQALAAPDLAGFGALDSREGFCRLLNELQARWAAEQERLIGAELERRREEMMRLSALLGDVQSCWMRVEPRMAPLFLAYHRLGRRFHASGSLGCVMHTRRLAELTCRHLGMGDSAERLATVSRLLEQHGRRKVVDVACELCRPGALAGVRDVLAVLIHRLRQTVEPLPFRRSEGEGTKAAQAR